MSTITPIVPTGTSYGTPRHRLSYRTALPTRFHMFLGLPNSSFFDFRIRNGLFRTLIHFFTVHLLGKSSPTHGVIRLEWKIICRTNSLKKAPSTTLADGRWKDGLRGQH